jgi:hypothetical protein
MEGIAYRMGVPDSYGSGNDVTMRLFFHRSGDYEGNCFIFTVDGRRLRYGSAIEVYGDVRWVRVDAEDLESNGGDVAGFESFGVFLVIDLPINTSAGLGYPDDLAGGDLLAFELHTDQMDGREYHLLGVEFFESSAGSAVSSGATVFGSDDEIDCGFEDCNENGFPDDFDISHEISMDCNETGVPDECELEDNDCNQNGIPDECDIADETSADCNQNGIPDDCELVDNDCNETGIPDECELEGNDCNESGVPDECELADNDCNENSVPDECDIASGYSQDCQPNGIPDECDGGCVECLSDIDCEDDDLCTVDTCAQGECVHEPLECPEGYVCVDGECVGEF